MSGMGWTFALGYVSLWKIVHIGCTSAVTGLVDGLGNGTRVIWPYVLIKSPIIGGVSLAIRGNESIKTNQERVGKLWKTHLPSNAGYNAMFLVRSSMKRNSKV